MKLSELVNYRNQLDAMSASPVGLTADREIEKITYLATNQNIQIAEFAQQLQQRRIDIQQSFDLFENDLTALKLEIKHLVEVTEKPWFAESYRLYDQEMQNETVDDIQNRKPVLDKSIEDFYHQRISRYQGWQHSAMIIRPGFESYIDSMVACDPLYLVDVKHELLEPAINRYNTVYQNRLRPYVVTERDNGEILSKLPNQQFGLVYAYNFFNFRPFELVRRYLSEIYIKLKPGGMCIITINDCDRDKAVDLVERHFCCYTPGSLVEHMVQSIGFEIEFKWHHDGPSTWLELRRPGQLHTLRGGQTLAKILPKPVAESK